MKVFIKDVVCSCKESVPVYHIQCMQEQFKKFEYVSPILNMLDIVLCSAYGNFLNGSKKKSQNSNM